MKTVYALAGAREMRRAKHWATRVKISAGIAQHQIGGIGQKEVTALVYRTTLRGDQVHRLFFKGREHSARTVLAQWRRGELLVTWRGGSTPPTPHANRCSRAVSPRGSGERRRGGADKLRGAQGCRGHMSPLAYEGSVP